MQIIINILTEDENVLNNDLLDIQDWVQQAVIGKINNCKKRMIREWEQKLKERYITLPTSDSDLITKIRAEPDYKDRVARDAKEAVL